MLEKAEDVEPHESRWGLEMLGGAVTAQSMAAAGRFLAGEMSDRSRYEVRMGFRARKGDS